MLLVAGAQLSVTAQAFLMPKSFYEDFPLGRGWVAAFPAYNEHLIYDYAGFTLGAAGGLVLAAVWLDRRAVQLALAAWLLGAVPHLTYHAVKIDRYDAGDAIANMTALGLYVLIPALLLFKTKEEADAETRRSSAARAVS